MIPYSKQNISEEDIQAVSATLRSDFLTNGPKIPEFEKEFAKSVGAEYAVAVSSGTAALHLACLAANLKQNDEIITSPMTFAASANCALYCGAKPIFVDINKQGLIDETKINEKISDKTKIILPVHYAGLPCNIKKIREIANQNNIIIEDACHALGARYNNSKIGDCKYSDMTAFSFHPVKHITTGEGGMITTNSKYFYEKLLVLRNHGITKNQEKLIDKHEGPWHQEIQELGFNYRITDFQCALGLTQLKKVELFVNKRREIANKYDQAFKNRSDIEIIKEEADQFNSYHLYVTKLKNKEIRFNLFNYLKQKGILCQVHYIPVYWHPYYKLLGYEKGLCPKAEEFYERIISLPLFPSLKEEEQEYVIESINKFFETKNID